MLEQNTCASLSSHKISAKTYAATTDIMLSEESRYSYNCMHVYSVTLGRHTNILQPQCLGMQTIFMWMSVWFHNAELTVLLGQLNRRWWIGTIQQITRSSLQHNTAQLYSLHLTISKIDESLGHSSRLCPLAQIPLDMTRYLPLPLWHRKVNNWRWACWDMNSTWQRVVSCMWRVEWNMSDSCIHAVLFMISTAWKYVDILCPSWQANELARQCKSTETKYQLVVMNVTEC